MVPPTGIEEVRGRARDFARVLREAGADDVADSMDRMVAGFVDASTVRRSVEAIRQQLRHFRAYPEELPEQPVVHIAANRLEDACKDALRAGVIAPARLSLRAQGKRKLGVVFVTLMAAGLMLGVPLALAMAGVDFADLRGQRLLPTLRLPKGAVRKVHVHVLEESADPEHTSAVELYVAGRCPAQLAGGMSCRAAGERSFGSQTLPTFEVMLPGQAYGLSIAVAETRLVGAVGTGTLLLSATSETPEGLYVVPLAAAFSGYTIERCSWPQVLFSECTRELVGQDQQDVDRRVPSLQVEVVAHGPSESDADELAEQQREQQRALAERVQTITAMVDTVRSALDDTQRQIRKRRFEAARERLDELGRLFEPLDALIVSTPDDDALPKDVLSLRARFEDCARQQARFEDRAFDGVYAALMRQRSGSSTDDQIIARVAKRLGISGPFLERIYAEHAEQLEERMRRAQAAQQLAEQRAHDALLARCGPLPKGAFHEVQAYLSARARQLGIRLRMHECMTPRLSVETCWSVVCDFDDIRSRPDLLADEVVRRQWTFELRNGRVMRHRERAL